MSKNRVTTVYCMSALRNVHLLSETQMTMQQNWYHSPHLTVSLGLLTGSDPSASSLHFISLTLSLGETVIYHRHGKHSCGACVGLIFFGPRTALSLDAFCLFPQAVPPSSPWGGVQMRWPASTPGILRCAPSPGGTQAKMLLWGSHPSPLAAHITLQPLQAVSSAATPVLSLGLTSGVRASARSPRLHRASQAGALRAMTVHFSFCKLVVALSSEAKPRSVPPVRGLPGCRSFLLPQLAPRGTDPVPVPFSLSLSLSFICPAQSRGLPCHVRSLRPSATFGRRSGRSVAS